MKALLLISLCFFMKSGFAKSDCDRAILNMADSNKSDAIKKFEQGEFISEAEFERLSYSLNFSLTDSDKCFVYQTFLKACQDKVNQNLNNENGYGSTDRANGKNPNTNLAYGLAKRFSCRGKVDPEVVDLSTLFQEKAEKIDCSSVTDENRTYCTGGGVPADKAGHGRRYLETLGNTTAASAVTSAHNKLTDSDDTNDSPVSYGDLMYQYQYLESPQVSDQKHEKTQESVLLSIAGCELEDLSQCKKYMSSGSETLRNQNPINPLAAINLMEGMMCDATGQNCQRTLTNSIGVGDLLYHYTPGPSADGEGTNNNGGGMRMD